MLVSCDSSHLQTVVRPQTTQHQGQQRILVCLNTTEHCGGNPACTVHTRDNQVYMRYGLECHTKHTRRLGLDCIHTDLCHTYTYGNTYIQNSYYTVAVHMQVSVGINCATVNSSHLQTVVRPQTTQHQGQQRILVSLNTTEHCGGIPACTVHTHETIKCRRGMDWSVTANILEDWDWITHVQFIHIPTNMDIQKSYENVAVCTYECMHVGTYLYMSNSCMYCTACIICTNSE